MRLVGSGEIYTDASSLKFGSVEVVDTFLGFLGAGHSDESKATGSFSPLIVDNVDTLNGTKPAELVIQVALPRLNRQTKDTNHL